MLLYRFPLWKPIDWCNQIAPILFFAYKLQVKHLPAWWCYRLTRAVFHTVGCSFFSLCRRALNMAASVTTNESATALLRKIEHAPQPHVAPPRADQRARAPVVMHDSNKRPRVASTGELESQAKKNNTASLTQLGQCSSVAYGTTRRRCCAGRYCGGCGRWLSFFSAFLC